MQEQLRRAVGPGQPNDTAVVRLVQRLLDRSAALSGAAVPLSGKLDRATGAAILTFQRRVMRRAFADAVIRPGDDTFWRLSDRKSGRMLAGIRGGMNLTPFVGPATLSDDDFVRSAAQLQCEVRAVKTVATVESKKGAFDKLGRPSILFERHLFSRYRFGRHNKNFPEIANLVPGGYSRPISDVYERLQQAYSLGAVAALRATSWGAFQILGNNHADAGHGTVELFVQAMCRSAVEQLDAFVSFIEADSRKRQALQQKDWTRFALYYNGADQKSKPGAKPAKPYRELLAEAYAKN